MLRTGQPTVLFKIVHTDSLEASGLLEVMAWDIYRESYVNLTAVRDELVAPFGSLQREDCLAVEIFLLSSLSSEVVRTRECHRMM